MYYSEEDARNIVIQAGLRLVEQGLVSRTWGNISARISKTEMIITPSGLAYETLTPDKLVKVNIKDLSYSGSVKPSSEKGIHAMSYILRPEVGFVIHTHQFYATVVGLDEKDHMSAVSVAYGLPGTDKLCSNVMHAIASHPSKSSFFLLRHGVLCLGADCEDAFDKVSMLEAECKRIAETTMAGTNYFEQCAKQMDMLPAYIDDFAQLIGPSVALHRGYDAIAEGPDKEAREMILNKNCAAAIYASRTGGKPLGPFDASMQRGVYLTKYSKLKEKG